MSANKYSKHRKLAFETVRRYCLEGKIPAEKKGKSWLIDQEKADEILDNYISISNNPPEGGSNLRLTAARAEKEEHVAHLKQMEALKMAGDLVEAAKVKKEAFAMARKVRNKMLNIPQKIAAELACETDPHRCEIMLDKEIREALKELSKR